MSRLPRLALVLSVALCVSLLLVSGGTGARTGAAPAMTEVVVTLPQPPLAVAALSDRSLASATSHHRVDVRAPAAVSYLRTLASAQRTLQSRIATAIPGSSVRWRYSVVLNGLAVVLPTADVARLSAIPGATVWPSVTYHALLNTGPQLIGAPAVWGSTLATAGQGMKIGVIDDGVDQTHPYLDSSGFSYPAGFPKGNTAFTTPKVIVARAFTPANETWKYANAPFDPVNSQHATHVAGIAAGDYNTTANLLGTKLKVSGVAPMAYIGNYKVLTIPTADFGLDGNSPEIAAGIEAAVSDGMNVINLSLGEPEIQLKRDLVVKAIEDAAAAGVVPVIAAGNEFDDGGRGTIDSPGSAPDAITVAASTESDTGPPDEIASFSSSGPTPISLQMKPDVTAPGVDVVSSLPGSQWASWSGTSMATPHVAGAAAVLMQRHPTWTVQEIKSALESTGDPVHVPATSTEVASTREGGGRIDLARADNPLIFTKPTGLSFGLVGVGRSATQTLQVDDAGGGPAPWTVTVQAQQTPTGAVLAPAMPTVVPGSSVDIDLSVSTTAAEGEATGFVVLTRGTDVRRVPYWFRVESPKLGTEPARTLTHAGVYSGNTRGKPSLVSSYRYPDGSTGLPIPTALGGPEQIYRFTLTRTVANFGVAVLSHAKGVQVSPRLVAAGDENRLIGNTGLPVDLNPYSNFGTPEPVVGAVLPTTGVYDFVFDTPSGAQPGAFTFRFWINDTTPPTARLLTHTVTPMDPLKLAVTDSGSGVDPVSIAISIDRVPATFHYEHGILTVPPERLSRGTHRLRLSVADYQETKNMEDVLNGATPNTRVYATTFVVR
ncbi:MAG TPA: S8 family serine peptidase [Gaiellaceae bacterium]